MDNCIWKEDRDTAWNTSCGNAFYLDYDIPSTNGMKFCCYCGKPLEEIPYKDKD